MTTFKEMDSIGVENFAQLGRAFYKFGCGAWLVAVLADGREVYYEDEAAREIVGDTELQEIKIGSIVEGSDAGVGPYSATSARELDDLHEQVGEEVSELWEEANEGWDEE